MEQKDVKKLCFEYYFLMNKDDVAIEMLKSLDISQLNHFLVVVKNYVLNIVLLLNKNDVAFEMLNSLDNSQLNHFLVSC